MWWQGERANFSGGGFPNLITCRQRPTGRAGRAQDAQDATLRHAPSGSSPSRHPWLVGLSRGLCRGLRRNKQTPSPPLPLPRGRKAAPSIRSTCRPTLDAVAHSSCQLSTRFRLNSTKIVFAPTHAENPRPCNPRRLRGRPSTSVGGITRLYCAHTRESNALRLQSAFLLAFWRLFFALICVDLR